MQTPDQPLLITQREGALATLTLNRPNAYNALSIALMEQFLGTLESLEKDKGVGCIILKAAGKGFCAGHDLKELVAEDNVTKRRAIFNLCSKLMLKLQTIPMPVIAAVHGVATAAGCQLVASCDLAIATDSAKFGTPGVNIGLFCSTPMVALSRAVGRKRAMRMLLEGELIDAHKAEQFGLINEVVPEDQLLSAVQTMADKILSKSRPTVTIGKQSFYRQLDMDTALAYDYCSEVMAINLGQSDAQEGIDAFLNKRNPNWKH